MIKQAPKNIRYLVWDKYIGAENSVGNCQFCKREIHMYDFHCSHIISAYNGGNIDVKNLIPLCALCNLSMGCN